PDWDIPSPEELSESLPDFEVFEMIGRGGMGIVYRARQPELKREVAIKILPEVWKLDPNALERFRREARSMARVQHPNLITIFETGDTARECPFFAMEFVPGQDLNEWIRAEQRSKTEILDLFPRSAMAFSMRTRMGSFIGI
ncbi:MAG: protein kinase, partial [Verrucomicrobiota bacterium]